MNGIYKNICISGATYYSGGRIGYINLAECRVEVVVLIELAEHNNMTTTQRHMTCVLLSL